MSEWSSERTEQMVAFQAEAMRRLDDMKRDRARSMQRAGDAENDNGGWLARWRALDPISRSACWMLVGYVLMIAALMAMVVIAK